jgi:hypothetical protein
MQRKLFSYAKSNQPPRIARSVDRLAFIFLLGLTSCGPASISEAPSSPEPPAGEILPSFEGKFNSETGTVKYELSLERRDFSLHTMVNGNMYLQTHISNFEIGGVRGHDKALELTGKDQQAGAMPPTTLRIAVLPGDVYELTRIKPLGGTVGQFKRASP